MLVSQSAVYRERPMMFECLEVQIVHKLSTITATFAAVVFFCFSNFSIELVHVWLCFSICLNREPLAITVLL